MAHPVFIVTQVNHVSSLRTYPIRAISLAILNLGSAQNPHVLRVRSGFSALSESKLAAPINAYWNRPLLFIFWRRIIPI
ncbi:hypothetical protein DMB41_00145 [Pectobacterium carotovorum subsp. carotovorum]|nr:hypothetical protein DMB41_00145 [Pectobacterium carotovorum subsp. carotovorum]